jgi:carbon starvation protein
VADFLNTPFLWVVGTVLLYAVAYFVYGRWIDRNVWRSDAKRATPAHMYMDGVEYFPTSRYVLWGYQFKSVAALGPILGPFIGVTFGWLPALLWIIGGNFFIGWLQDYGSMMLSVRKEGRSFGPITYEFTGAGGRTNLLAFVLFYLIILSAAFIALIATFWNSFKGTTFVPTIGILFAGLLAGQLLYRFKMNVFVVTGIGLALIVLSLYLGTVLPVVLPWGAWNIAVWAGVCVLILYIAAILPTPTFIQPTNYLAFYPAVAAVILIIVGALATPFTGVDIKLPAGPFLTDPQGLLGPIWPILFVAIACGAISGWHSLVSSSSSSKQLDVETDALPVGGGAMLSEGLLALASLIAYMVLTPTFVFGIPGDPANPSHTNVASWPVGAALLVSKLLGVDAANIVLTTFFGLVLIVYALTVQALVTRFFRLVAAETWGEGRFRLFGNKHVATAVGLGVPWAFAVSGSWWALWLYFGGANQLLAGLAIMLISIHLARVRAPTKYSLIPGIFMIVTTLAALLWQTWTFVYSVSLYLQGDKSWVVRNVRGPIQTDPNYILVAVVINGVFVLVGALLFLVGVSMAIRLFRSYRSSVAEARAPVAADGGTPKE